MPDDTPERPGRLAPPAPASERYKAFYERWAELRVDPVEADYNWQASLWKWQNLERLIRAHGEPASLLEFGCGSGEMLALARDAFPGVELHGYDIAERMIELARERLGDVHLTRGAEEALERHAPPVDVALAVDILEHLVEPRRAIRALGSAGRRVALKIPLERRRIRLGIQRQRVGVEHVAGHLHFWTVGDARRLLADAGLEVIEDFVDDPPESIRYHEAVLRQERDHPRTPLGLARSAHRRLEVALERWTCRVRPRWHRWLFGTSHFVLARARDAATAAG
jgi:SAM-dependent methyltransferase